MKKFILIAMITCGFAYAGDVVTYDQPHTDTTISKPNHPTTEIYN